MRLQQFRPWRTVKQLLEVLTVFRQLLLGRGAIFAAILGLVVIGAILDAVAIALLGPLVSAIQPTTTFKLPPFLSFLLPLGSSPTRIALLVLVIFVVKNSIVLFRIRAGVVFLSDLWRRWVGRIVDRLLHRPGDLPSHFKSGEVVAVSLTETREVIDAYIGLLNLAVAMFTLLAVYVVLWISSWQATLAISLLAVLLLFAGGRTLTRKSHEAGSQLVLSLERANSLLIESVIGRRDITAFGQEDLFENWLDKPLGRISHSMANIQWLRNLLHPLLETIAVTGFCLFVMLASHFSIKELPTVLPVIAVFAGAAFRLFPLMTATGTQWVVIVSRMVPAERILSMFDVRGRFSGYKEIHKMNRSIGLDRVAFNYPGRLSALNGVSLSIARGERVALVGESGSGKSTVVSLLMGFISAGEGNISVDGTPLEEINTSSWRRLIGYVGQESILFNMSLAENIAFGRSSGDAEDVRRAATVAGLNELIETLPEGMGTKVGERGLELSGGQRQRVLLARAILVRPSILVLDEAMSALDNDSGAKLMRDIELLMPDTTWVVVAHRLGLVTKFDRIVVMRNGQIVEQGNHEELLQRDGYYGQLLRVEVNTM